MSPKSDVLQRIPLFREMSTALLGRVAALSTLVAVPQGEVLHDRGDSPTVLNFVLEGRVMLTGAAADGTSAVVDVVQPVSGVSLPTVLADLPFPMAARAGVASLLVVVTAAPLRALLAQTPALARAAMQDMAVEFGAMVRQVLDLKLRSAPQRLGCYLLELVVDPAVDQADFRLPFDKGLLAARLGCRQENLSRAFATLRDVGVETHGGRVILHDIPALRDFAALGPGDERIPAVVLAATQAGLAGSQTGPAPGEAAKAG